MNLSLLKKKVIEMKKKYITFIEIINYFYLLKKNETKL